MMLAFKVQTVALLGWRCNEESTGYFCISTWNDSVNDLVLCFSAYFEQGILKEASL